MVLAKLWQSVDELQNPISSSTTPDPAADAFRQELRQLGYDDGKDIRVEYRYAGDTREDRIQELVAAIVQLKVDVFVFPANVSNSHR